ncbi:MAG: ATP-binding protein [Blautia sp.]
MTKPISPTGTEIPSDAEDYKALYLEQKIQHQFMLSKISHEIRNPVTLVNSFLQILEDHHPDLTEDSCWMKIMENMDFLKKLLNEFSNFNNSEKIALQPVNLYYLFSAITDSTAPELSQKGISITLEKRSPIPLIPVDELKIRQLLLNLIRNAAESIAEKGTITCAIESDGETVTLSVADTGCGILPEQQHNIFEPFTTFKQEGTGLGLPICKRIAEAHKGTLSFTSTPGKGTTFRLVLPVS